MSNAISIRKYNLVFLSLMLTRLLYIIWVQLINPEGIYLFDSWQYLNIAHNLFYEQSFSQIPDLPEVPDATRTPVYPIFIWIFHLIKWPGWTIVIVQSFLSLATGLLLVNLAVKIAGRTAFWWAAAFYILDLPSLFFANTVLTETLFTTLFTAFAFTLFNWLQNRKKHWLIMAAILLGIATLTRPVSVHLIWILPVVGISLNKQLIKSYLFFALLASLTISPWVVRNSVTFNRPFLSTISEVNLLFHNATAIKSTHTEYSQKQVEYQYRDQLLGDLNFYETSSVGTIIDRARKESLSQIKQHPLTFVNIWIKGQVSFYFKPLRSYIYQQLQGKEGSVAFGMTSSYSNIPGVISSLSFRDIPILGFQWIHLLLIYIGILMLAIKRQLSSPWMVFSVIMILYFSSTAAFTEVDARFRVPALPLMALMSAVGWKLLNWPREKV